MKNFIRNTVLFLLLIVVFIETTSTILLFNNLYLFNYPGKDIYISIEKSKKKNKTKILLLGDSVGKQLFDNKQNFDRLNSFACNQAISMAGQYFLLHNYLEAGNNIDKLIIIYNPFSFRNNLNQVYTFHYFLKPFYNSDYLSLFSSTVNEQINKIPYNKFVQLPHIRITSWAPEFNTTEPEITSLLSPISIEYLNEIKNLANQYNFEINILPPPISVTRKNEIEKLKLDVFTECNLKQEFEDYFTKITYLDSTEFSDGIHLIHPEKYTNSFIKEIIK